MELGVLDPFGDYETAGYLRNYFAEKDQSIIGRLETAAFEAQVEPALRFLRRLVPVQYPDIKTVHRMLFDSVYPWAGQDRFETAPRIRILKGGHRDLFALPDSIGFAVEYALRLASDLSYMRAHPGEVFGYLAHAHPFLEGNGRTILTVYSELARRAHFHVRWEEIQRQEFLETLTAELKKPGSMMDALVLRYLESGALPLRRAASKLNINFSR